MDSLLSIIAPTLIFMICILAIEFAAVCSLVTYFRNGTYLKLPCNSINDIKTALGFASKLGGLRALFDFNKETYANSKLSI